MGKIMPAIPANPACKSQNGVAGILSRRPPIQSTKLFAGQSISRGIAELFQILVEPCDRSIQPIDLVPWFDKEMPFAWIYDELCRHAKGP